MAGNPLQFAHAEFDIREDEDQAVRMQDTIDLLLAAGYFRARIKALSEFDRIVGGMVWCITLCNTSIDVDLIYSENLSIGQKIALTERVVEVLTQLKCPHTIEPHQIQGRDFINIYPVVQWLVRQAVEAKEKYGDKIRSHAVYQFNNKCYSQRPDEEILAKKDFAKSYQQLKSMFSPQRIYRRTGNFVCNNFHEDIQCTLMEYGWKNFTPQRGHEDQDGGAEERVDELAETQVAERLQEQLSRSEDLQYKQRVSKRTLVQLIDTEKLRDATADVERILRMPVVGKGSAVDQLAGAQLELQAAKEEEIRLQELISSVESINTTLADEIAHYEELLDKLRSSEENVNENELVRLKRMIEAYDEMKSRESRFKADCKIELERMDEEIGRLRAFEMLESEAKDAEIQRQENEEVLSRLEEMRGEDSKLNRQIAMAQRRLDSVPSQIEVSQYQRRIVELYNQMAVKNREIKQLYNLHNTLIDVKSCVNKEIDLMNNIEDVQETALKESYKQSFLENLQKILRGVDTTYDRVVVRRADLERSRDKLRGDYQYLLEKERLYHKTVDDFKEECQKNEDLSKKLKSLGLESELS